MRLFAMALGALLLAGCAHQDHRAQVERYPSPEDPQGKLPFSEVVRAGGLLFQSGRVGVEPGTLKLVPGGIGPETRQAMEYVKEAFARHGVGMERVVKCTVFLADMKEWAAMNEVYVTYFPAGKPARSALGASGLALGARVEIACIAAL